MSVGFGSFCGVDATQAVGGHRDQTADGDREAQVHRPLGGGATRDLELERAAALDPRGIARVPIGEADWRDFGDSFVVEVGYQARRAGSIQVTCDIE